MPAATASNPALAEPPAQAKTCPPPPKAISGYKQKNENVNADVNVGTTVEAALQRRVDDAIRCGLQPPWSRSLAIAKKTSRGLRPTSFSLRLRGAEARLFHGCAHISQLTPP